TDFIWRRSALPFRGKKYWNGVSVTHPFYDTRLYKKQLTNTKDLEVDDEPYIVLPPDNTINTKEEAFKLDEGGATTAETTTPSTIPPTTTTTQTTQTTITTVTTPTTPLTTPTTLPPITTITTPPTTPTTPPTTPTPPPTTKPTEKVQVIAIHAGTPPTKRAFPTAANINLNLEIGDNGDASQPEQHESVPVTPTAQSIYTINQQEQSAEQPTPQVIIAPMPGGMGASQNQQPQIIMAQPAQTPPQQPQVVYAPQPPAQQQPQYVIAPQQPEQPQPEYVMQPVIQPVQQPAPISTSPMYLQQAPPPRAVIAAPQTPMYGQPNVAAPQVSISASPPASITVNSPGVQSPIGGLNNMLMPASYMGMPPANPFLMGSQMGMNGLQMPLFQNPQLSLSQGWPSPLGQLPQQFPSSPLLSSLPQGYDPLLYSGLIGMFANAIRSSMIQPQPNVLASALALAASQAQARNQPADLLTAALTQALAQNLQQGIQPISNAKLVQALSQALSQGQPAMRQNSNQPPPPPPPNQQQPPPPLPPRPGPTPYPQIKIPPYQVVPNTDQPQWPPYRDTRSDAANNNYSVNKVGKALASALIKAARKIASRNPSVTKTSHRDARYRHRNRERERSFVPLQHSRLNSKTMNPVKTQLADKDMKTIFAMFRPFWKNIAKRCNLRGCLLLQRCSS
ncbi:unnamed protein product, partial [Porites lobata]